MGNLEQVKEGDNDRTMLMEEVLLQKVIYDLIRKRQGRRCPVDQALDRAFTDKDLAQVSSFGEGAEEELFLCALCFSPKYSGGSNPDFIG